MRVSIVAAVAAALFSAGSLLAQSAAQDSAGPRIAAANPAVATPAAAPAPKFQFILFWKENNPATQGMATSLKAAVDQRSPRAEWTSVNVTDPAQLPTVERYRVGRAPMPMVLCVAPNGVVTGAITRQLSDAAIDNLLVTPAMAELAKALQEKRIVVIHAQPDPRQPLPAGAAQFVADPAFKDRTTVLNVGLSDPAEARLIAEMKINTGQTAESTLVVLAPPGVLVGKFPASATGSQIGAALHAAGKCCNDPNCKHNQQGK